MTHGTLPLREGRSFCFGEGSLPPTSNELLTPPQGGSVVNEEELQCLNGWILNFSS
jgi:hypothetical protein